MAVKQIGKDKWPAFKKMLAKLPGVEVVVGIPGEIDFSAPNVAAIGVVHEFGSTDGTTPARSFIGATFDINEKKYARLMERMIAKATKAGTFQESSLFVVGEVARGDVIGRIVGGDIPKDPLGTGRVKTTGTTLVVRGASGGLVGGIISEVRKR